MPIGAIWQTFLETPLINFIIALARVSFGSYGLSILLFTVITRGVTFPLTLRTLRSMKKMQEIGPLLQEVNKRYSDPRRRSEETMKIYKENGVNPLGCLGPQLLQMPVFIALYATIRLTMGNTPEGMLALSSRLYDIEFIRHAIPLSTNFLGMDLSENGTLPLGVAVFSAMWLQQRISASRTASPSGSQQAQMNQTMQWFMPVFFGYFFVVSLPAALGLYWGVGTVISLVLQWVFVGPGDFTWGSLVPRSFQWRPAVAGAGNRATPRAASSGHSDSGDSDAHASGGGERQDGRRGGGEGPGTAGPPPRSGRRRRYPRR
jgi:YidC/Oxa1 family membrane protein insertase